MSDPESLLKKIAEEEARLVRIDKVRDEALARLNDLRDRLIGDLPVPTSPYWREGSTAEMTHP